MIIEVDKRMLGGQLKLVNEQLMHLYEVMPAMTMIRRHHDLELLAATWNQLVTMLLACEVDE